MPLAPQWVLSLVLGHLQEVVRAKNGAEFSGLCPLRVVGKTRMPALFAHADCDDFIVPAHGRRLHRRYLGRKEFMRLSGDHNSVRSREFLDLAAQFLMQAFVPRRDCFHAL